MKKIVVIANFLLALNFVQGQMTMGNLYVGNTLQDKDSIPRQDRWVFDISHEQWLSSPKGINNKIYSWGFAFTRMFEHPFSRNFSLAFGVGIRTAQNYHNGSFEKYVKADNSVKDSLIAINPKTDYKLNKTAANYVDASVEMRIKAGKNKGFKLYFGFKGGYMFDEHLKYRDAFIKYKRYDNNGFNKLSYGPTVRIGINNICLFAFYRLSPFYGNNSGQKIESCSVGITFFFL